MHLAKCLILWCVGKGGVCESAFGASGTGTGGFSGFLDKVSATPKELPGQNNKQTQNTKNVDKVLRQEETNILIPFGEGFDRFL